MTSGSYKKTEKHKKNISNALKGRPSSLKGKRRPLFSATWKKNISKGKKGKPRAGNSINWKHTQKQKDTMSKNHANVSGKNNPMYGRKQTIKARKKIKYKLTGNKNKCGYKYDKESKKKMSIYRINNPIKKFSGTTIELKMREELEKRGFRKNIDYFCNIGLNKIANVDIYLPAYKIVIECDGCYYHECPKHCPTSFNGSRQQNDIRKTTLLQQNGYTVYRFWEHEINKNVKQCIDYIFVNILENFKPLQI